MDNPFSLSGKTILITGDASGIGKATDYLCNQLGASLVLVDLNEDGLNNLGIDNAVSFPADLTDVSKVEEIASASPKLDGVVSNAGIVFSLLAKFNEQSDLERIFRINTFSHINLIQSLIRNKKLNKGASIVLTSSMSGTVSPIHS